MDFLEETDRGFEVLSRGSRCVFQRRRVATDERDSLILQSEATPWCLLELHRQQLDGRTHRCKYTWMQKITRVPSFRKTCTINGGRCTWFTFTYALKHTNKSWTPFITFYKMFIDWILGENFSDDFYIRPYVSISVIDSLNPEDFEIFAFILSFVLDFMYGIKILI